MLGQRSDGVYGVQGYHREERDVRGGYWRVVHSRGGARTWIGQRGGGHGPCPKGALLHCVSSRF